jgi:hypothetical protein
LIRCYNVKPPNLAYSGLHTVSLCSSSDECRRRQKRPQGITLVGSAAGTRTLSAALMPPCKNIARLTSATLYQSLVVDLHAGCELGLPQGPPGLLAVERVDLLSEASGRQADATVRSYSPSGAAWR